MISTFNTSLPKLLFVMLFVICTVCPLKAQIAGGISETTTSNWGGNSYIVGSVLLPDGNPVNSRISITLQSQTKGELIAMTDDNGKFVFSRIPSGIYTFIFQGDSEFERVNQEVEVLQQRNSVSLTIRLRYKAKFTVKPGVINSDFAGVPKKALDFYNKALKLISSNDIKGAIEQLKLAVTQYSEFNAAFNEMGIQYMRLNELEKADESFLAALKIKPDVFATLTNRGIVLFRLKKFADAETALRAALKISEKSAVCHYYLGRLLSGLERSDEAEKQFILAIKLDEKEMVEAHRMLANLYITKEDYKNAITELEIYLRMNPKASDAEQLRQVLSKLKSLIH